MDAVEDVARRTLYARAQVLTSTRTGAAHLAIPMGKVAIEDLPTDERLTSLAPAAKGCPLTDLRYAEQVAHGLGW